MGKGQMGSVGWENLHFQTFYQQVCVCWNRAGGHLKHGQGLLQTWEHSAQVRAKTVPWHEGWGHNSAFPHPRVRSGSLSSHSSSSEPEKVPALQLLHLEIPHLRKKLLALSPSTGYTFSSDLNTRAQLWV